ncbi:AMP-dependent synthetase/ligase [Penicillium cf. griseofulvum]|uniref:AMP-dependent synthetase/ligase n=1 Tax=Penicillium cf. griseofulvum TaxID=2972120 RepID=A0A9W9J572_9EURO|nr:AMP-dependent synthetase/ligase [Penicillium cf. griseofulvum]KAJ5427480.1 AMP-dependent synthetase/ligase [Penicillium cf. griseofulvum]KAJ5431681.1 AMP-dependent synthetase/ligase [Penicillium cf. griseofulvum]
MSVLFEVSHCLDQRVKATSVTQLFIDNVRRQPKSPAIIDIDSVITYEELHLSALSLAFQLRSNAYALEEPTGVLVNPGSWSVIIQLAVMYAGGTLVPVCPDENDEKIQCKLANVGVKYLIVDEPNKFRLPMFTCIPISDRSKLLSSVPMDGLHGQIPVTTTLDHRTHILFTSGTTGEPKGVQISARSLLHIIHHIPISPLEPSDVMAHYIPTTFDYTLVEIFAPLVVGAQIAILPYADAFDGRTLEATLRKQGVTVMIIVTALLNIVSFTNPGAFSTLRMVLFGGDAASPKAISRLLESGAAPTRLINAYGPTETCCWSLTHELSMNDTHSEPVSIGKPTGDTIVHILDDALQPIPDGEVGELFLGGSGVTRGYMNDQEKNLTSFINIKDLPGLDATARFYRTGDLVRRDASSGQVYYLGRQDHQVTIFTMRIELAAVKAALMRTGRFADAVTLAIDSPIKEMGKLLVAYVIPAEDIAKDKVLDGIGSVLAPYLPYPEAMPHIEVIDRFPLTIHFKVDRKALSRRYIATWDSYMQGNDNDTARTTEQQLAFIWAGVLAMPAVKFTSDDNFFAFIRSEFQGAYLLLQIQLVFGATVFLHELQTSPTLCTMAGLIDRILVT